MAAKGKKSDQATTEELSKLVFKDLNQAEEAVTVEERGAYQEAQKSVVDARRSAERFARGRRPNH